MQEFSGRVAVVTGAGSGIGRALAHHCAQEGMKVVVADVNAQALAQVEAELTQIGASVCAVPTDVSKAQDVENLAEQTVRTFGKVNLLFNNAGVGRVNRTWETSLSEWEWVIGVNLWGVIHGVRTFVPLMLAQQEEAHIINTASIAGLITGPGLGVYKVTKHAVVALSEVLFYELAQESDRVKVSVLCPGWVNTPIFDNAVRNRPSHIPVEATKYDVEREREAQMRAATRAGFAPERIAAEVFAAICEDRFYILTHPEFNAVVQQRIEDILNRRNPTRS